MHAHGPCNTFRRANPHYAVHLRGGLLALAGSYLLIGQASLTAKAARQGVLFDTTRFGAFKVYLVASRVARC